MTKKITPEEFKKRMEEIAQQAQIDHDWEHAHGEAYHLMEKVLEQHGFKDGVDAVKGMKWE
jgi:hypothetical protein